MILMRNAKALFAATAAAAATLTSAMLVAPAASQDDSLAFRSNFRIGNAGVRCTAQSAPAEERLNGMFDRAYRLTCRDAASAIGTGSSRSASNDALANVSAAISASSSACSAGSAATASSTARVSAGDNSPSRKALSFSESMLTDRDTKPNSFDVFMSRENQFLGKGEKIRI